MILKNQKFWEMCGERVLLERGGGLLYGDKKFSVSAAYKEILSTWHNDSTRETASTTS